MAIFENKGQYLLITPEGPYTLEKYRKALQEAAEFCRQNGLKKVLADIRGIDQNISTLDRFELGIQIAKILGNQIKIAILARPEIIDRMGENAAVNRGGKAFVTDSMEKALEWLGVE